jgi:hypothetical protein
MDNDSRGQSSSSATGLVGSYGMYLGISVVLILLPPMYDAVGRCSAG